ncbi:MAG: protein translocase subunit SecF [Croceicoccus sp.]|nr:protein translocase subunit SecF [Croceicoccus sp.]MAL27381.1 protein translocase subunit SecF [Croceicoccus sp.]|tara:strand:- start:4603 stop:5589 length:987 start_codon:yes stop_codon:yes gene_type:complete
MKLLKLVPDTTNIHFLKWRVPFYVVSVLLMIASWALVATQGLNLGVDFVGGQMIRATFTQEAEAPVAELRREIGSLGYGEPVIQRFGQPNEVSIRMRLPETEEGATAAKDLADRMTSAITGNMEQNHPGVRIDGVDSVSGKVSGELFETGMMALLGAMVMISIYIWIRFEWQFGVGAMFALLHDVSLTLGLFAITGLEFDLNIVAAILAIIGYSLNDTIIVYDRVRENLKKYRKMPMAELLDLSVNETLARTVMTSLTTLTVLMVLMFVGPAMTFGFAAAIAFGIFVGTYSSIYMAAPILIWLRVKSDSFVPRENEADRQERLARGQV